MKQSIKVLAIGLLVALFAQQTAQAQHTIGVSFGTGMANGRFEPTQETKPI